MWESLSGEQGTLLRGASLGFLGSASVKASAERWLARIMRRPKAQLIPVRRLDAGAPNWLGKAGDTRVGGEALEGPDITKAETNS